MNTKEAADTAAKQECMKTGDSTCRSDNGGNPLALDQSGGANAAERPTVTNETGQKTAPDNSTQSGSFNPLEAAFTLFNDTPAGKGLGFASGMANALFNKPTQDGNLTQNSTVQNQNPDQSTKPLTESQNQEEKPDTTMTSDENKTTTT
ncbi:hypothetical protein CWI36_0618p0020 [Hamiltosporidium magnivora]|uniref:Uncharacterized protein n=1 Tax=Hamiltosporidium magnivora TaxID=148818 RepID=A0A4V6MVF5_9MICR|nr:hypothetical protein CWI36_0618p0020 [Hamiltosporidium magnivora]